MGGARWQAEFGGVGSAPGEPFGDVVTGAAESGGVADDIGGGSSLLQDDSGGFLEIDARDAIADFLEQMRRPDFAGLCIDLEGPLPGGFEQGEHGFAQHVGCGQSLIGVTVFGPVEQVVDSAGISEAHEAFGLPDLVPGVWWIWVGIDQGAESLLVDSGCGEPGGLADISAGVGLNDGSESFEGRDSAAVAEGVGVCLSDVCVGLAG